jgi:hypothetical protein
MYSVPEIASKLILRFIIGYLWPVFQCGQIVTVSDKNTFEPKNKKPQKTLIHTFNKLELIVVITIWLPNLVCNNSILTRIYQ